jgi:hypothetical protein
MQLQLSITTSGSTEEAEAKPNGAPMNRQKLLLALVLAVIVVAGLLYLMPGHDVPPGQQASPHAINQPG